MGRNLHAGLRRLVAMGRSEPVDYKPPPVNLCDVESYTIELDGSMKACVRTSFYQRRLVDFAISIWTKDHGEWSEVARYDCKHSTVHRHEFSRYGGETKTTICRIPGDDDHSAWELIAQQYDISYVDLFDAWLEYLAKWRQT